MDWTNAAIIPSESHKYKRWTKEAIEIRERGVEAINGEEGALTPAHTQDALLQGPPGDGGHSRHGRSHDLPPRRLHPETPADQTRHSSVTATL